VTLINEKLLLQDEVNSTKSALKYSEVQREELQRTSSEKEKGLLKNILSLTEEGLQLKREAENSKIETNRSIAAHEVLLRICIEKEVASQVKVASLVNSSRKLEEQILSLEKGKIELEEQVASLVNGKTQLQGEVEDLKSEFNITLDQYNKEMRNLTTNFEAEKEV
jgi:hypothetical protein